MMPAPLTFKSYKGDQITGVFDELAALRIAVFYEFPYLYEGTPAYEKEYLKTYSASPYALVFAVWDAGRMVGATTCIPLADETEEVRRPFLEAGFAVPEVFYFGESVLLPAYRGRGLGHRFFDEREAHARSFGTFRSTCFCAVERPDDHPLKPEDYRANDVFWEKRDYRKIPALQTTFDWPDRGADTSTPKKMVYWLREL